MPAGRLRRWAPGSCARCGYSPAPTRVDAGPVTIRFCDACAKPVTRAFDLFTHFLKLSKGTP